MGQVLPCIYSIYILYTVQSRRQSSRLRGAKRLLGGGQSLKLSTKAAVFKSKSLLIGGTKHVDWALGADPDTVYE